MNHFPKVQDLERAHGVTWVELARLEPRLDELLWEARTEGSRCHRWKDVERVFAPFKNALTQVPLATLFQRRRRNQAPCRRRKEERRLVCLRCIRAKHRSFTPHRND